LAFEPCPERCSLEQDSLGFVDGDSKSDSVGTAALAHDVADDSDDFAFDRRVGLDQTQRRSANNQRAIGFTANVAN